MSLVDRAHDDIDEAELRRALERREREGIRAEFKLELGETSEIAKDVTSFANTAGGVLLLGADEKQGRLSALPGVDGDVDAELLRIDNVLRDVVDPPIPGLRMSAVDVDGRPVIVITIPRSWRAPHLVRRGDRWSVSRRNSSGKYQLDAASEVRLAFAESFDAADRARRWHDDRVAEVAAGQGAAAIDPGHFIVFSFRPLAAGASGATPVLDVDEAMRSSDQRLSSALFLHEGHAWGRRPNLDGICIIDATQSGPLGYTQIYRDGSVAFVDAYYLERDAIAGSGFATHLVGALLRGPALAEWAGGDVPIIAELTLHGTAGKRFHTRTEADLPGREPPSFNRNHLTLPALTIDHVPSDVDEVATLARPLLDGLWNSVGLARCDLYDLDGRWLGDRSI